MGAARTGPVVVVAWSLFGALGCTSGQLSAAPERVDAPAPSAPSEAVSLASRLVRLSQHQYSATVRDLLGVESAVEFPPDSLNGFLFDTSSDLRVDGRLSPQYRAAAEALSAAVVADSSAFARLVGCAPSEAGCASDWIARFGERAFRRPLTGDEQQRFETLFAAGGEAIGSGDQFRDGVQLVVEGALQSPQFLYRVEVSEGALQGGREALDAWEVASRISYFLYDSMPDDALFEAARSGALSSEAGVAAQVGRLVSDPRVASKLVSFHQQLWRFSKIARVAPDPEVFSDLPEDFAGRVNEAATRFVGEVIEEGGGLEQLLTARYAFADEGLASLYGQSVTGDFVRIELNDDRPGLLTQLGFLAANAYAQKTDPIHRGLFILRDILCRSVPDPPAGASTTPPPETDEPVLTTRDEVALLTEQGSCQRCHQEINGPGFAFEGFDAVGRRRSEENGVAVDTSGTITLDGARVAFSGATELVAALAASEDARNCYARRFAEFALGGTLPDEELGYIELTQGLSEEDLSVKELARRMSQSQVFLSRQGEP